MEWVINNDIDVVCASIELSSWDDEREELSRQEWEKNIIMIDLELGYHDIEIYFGDGIRIDLDAIDIDDTDELRSNK